MVRPRSCLPSLPLSRGSSLGFTLIEVMVVVVIIAILATIAVPTIVLRIREGRAQQTTQEIAGIYRGARMRALGRGASVLVHYKDGQWVVREGVEGAVASTARTGDASCQNLPTRGCTSNAWGDATSREVAEITPAGIAADIVSTVAFQGTATDELDVCFSPLGRTFVRNQAASWNPLTSVITVDVKRGDGLKRTVVVLPNGAARLAL